MLISLLHKDFRKTYKLLSVTNNPNNSYDIWGFSLAK